VIENRVLRKIFGPKRYEVTGEWRRLHNEEVYYLYSWPNIICVITSRRMKWAGHVRSGPMWESRGAYRILVGKPDRKRPLGKPRPRWEDNIEMDLRFAIQSIKIKINRTIIFPVVLYGCETWSLTLRQEHGLRVFENRVPRAIFDAKRDKVREEWRRLHNGELYDLWAMFLTKYVSFE
jgi:hypothetical protein